MSMRGGIAGRWTSAGACTLPLVIIPAFVEPVVDRTEN